MAKEPDDLVLRLLRQLRVTQQDQSKVLNDHSASLNHLKTRMDDLYRMSTHTLGVAVNADERYENLETRVDDLTSRLERLESKQAQ